MTIQQTIERKLTDSLSPLRLEVINESYMHSVPPGSESHFKVIIVSGAFEGERLVRRHQRVNEILAEELAGGVHALSMQTLTAEEWERKGGAVFASPACLGGSKADA